MNATSIHDVLARTGATDEPNWTEARRILANAADDEPTAESMILASLTLGLMHVPARSPKAASQAINVLIAGIQKSGWLRAFGAFRREPAFAPTAHPATAALATATSGSTNEVEPSSPRLAGKVVNRNPQWARAHRRHAEVAAQKARLEFADYLRRLLLLSLP